MYTNQVANVPMVDYMYGIGGRDTTTKDIVSVFEDLQEIIKTGNLGSPYRYLGLRFDRQNFEKILNDDDRSRA